MRLHISLDEDLVRELDRRIGPRDRSHFIGKAVRRALDELDRMDALDAALGAISDTGHDWDDDPAEWVRQQRADRPVAG